MLLPLLEDPDVMDLLAYFLNDFKNGLLPDELKPYLLPASLLALKKKIIIIQAYLLAGGMFQCSTWPELPVTAYKKLHATIFCIYSIIQQA